MNFKPDLMGIPLDRRRNRLWLVAAYWLIVVLVAILLMALFKTYPSSHFPILFVIFYVSLLSDTPHLSISIGRCFYESPDRLDKQTWGIRTLFDSASREENRKYPPLDERERSRLRNALEVSYGIVCLIVLLAFVAHEFGKIPHVAYIRETLFWLTPFVVFNLPKTILIYTEKDVEPDMEEPQ
ncbi:MAG: hypothetical protein ABSD67_03935 [Terracidiphilus sp.]|jgi:hypothetical protein